MFFSVYLYRNLKVFMALNFKLLIFKNMVINLNVLIHRLSCLNISAENILGGFGRHRVCSIIRNFILCINESGWCNAIFKQACKDK